MWLCDYVSKFPKLLHGGVTFLKFSKRLGIQKVIRGFVLNYLECLGVSTNESTWFCNHGHVRKCPNHEPFGRKTLNNSLKHSVRTTSGKPGWEQASYGHTRTISRYDQECCIVALAFATQPGPRKSPFLFRPSFNVWHVVWATQWWDIWLLVILRVSIWECTLCACATNGRRVCMSLRKILNLTCIRFERKRPWRS